jgi:hypothetical protein
MASSLHELTPVASLRSCVGFIITNPMHVATSFGFTRRLTSRPSRGFHLLLRTLDSSLETVPPFSSVPICRNESAEFRRREGSDTIVSPASMHLLYTSSPLMVIVYTIRLQKNIGSPRRSRWHASRYFSLYCCIMFKTTDCLSSLAPKAFPPPCAYTTVLLCRVDGLTSSSADVKVVDCVTRLHAMIAVRLSLRCISYN